MPDRPFNDPEFLQRIAQMDDEELVRWHADTQRMIGAYSFTMQEAKLREAFDQAPVIARELRDRLKTRRRTESNHA